MKIAYVTVSCPWSDGESFVVEEMRMALKKGCDLTIIPLRPLSFPKDTSARELLPFSLKEGLFSIVVIGTLFKVFLRCPYYLFKLLLTIIRKSRNFRILLKNLAVFPKGIFTGEIVRRREIEHIHAHWASTPTTVAWIASRMSGIPFSFTAHRWDISENNLLDTKCKDADFVRVISTDGRREIIRLTGERSLEKKLHLLYMGVEISKGSVKRKENRPFTIACPANLVEKKGHRYLLRSLRKLDKINRDFRCLIIGDGPLKDKIRWSVKKDGLEDKVILTGRIPHSTLMDTFKRGEIDLVVLPSIETRKGEREGIPVVLLEAMTHSIPVISTATGGIPELIEDHSGILIPERDENSLTTAILKVMEDEGLRDRLGDNGRRRVEELFDLDVNVGKLLSLMEKSIRGGLK